MIRACGSLAALGLTVLALGAQASCIVLAPQADGGAPLARIAVDERDGRFRIAYIHSVTRTPVEERYFVDGARIVQTEIRFVQHGPGLPTAADAGGSFAHRDGMFVVAGRRSFDEVVMRVHADQQPRLVAGASSVDLAGWGNRAIVMRARAGRCPAP
ncbi:MAG: DUF1850 domain-containing protein [Betaproteobacteria bacterium]